MQTTRRRLLARIGRCLLLFVAVGTLSARHTAAQSLTGALIGTVKDAQGGTVSGAVVKVSSPALLGGPAVTSTNEKGQLRFPVLPAGTYTLEIAKPGFAVHRVEDIRIGAGATLERAVVLQVAVSESVVVTGEGSRLEARHPGFGTRFDAEDLQTIPTRRSSNVRLHQGGSGHLADLTIERNGDEPVRA